MPAVGEIAACWIVVAVALVVVWGALATAGRTRSRRAREQEGTPDLLKDVEGSLAQVYSETRAVERGRALHYLRGLHDRRVRVVDVVPSGPCDRGDQVVFGDGTTVHLLPGRSSGVAELHAAVAASAGQVALTGVDLVPGRVVLVFRTSDCDVRVRSADLAVL